jgi:predicted HTH transcriptional regulator
VSDNVSDNLSMSDNVSDNESMSDNVSDNVSDNESMSDNVSDNVRRQAILAYIAKHGQINAAETAKIIKRSPETARRILSQLADEGILIASGANRNRVYHMKGD